MAHSHNTLIRGLNAILQQAPHVPDAKQAGFNPSDVRDFLFYVQSWVKMVSHHHWVEESFIFPEMERLTGDSAVMDDPKHQHEQFHSGLEKLLAYASATSAEDYRWEGDRGMRSIMDSFSGELTDHLYAEINVLLGLEHVDSGELRKSWDKAEGVAKQTGNLGMLVGQGVECTLLSHFLDDLMSLLKLANSCL